MDDILGEGSDDSDSEKKKPEEREEDKGPQPREPKTPGAQREHALEVKPPSERSERSMADGRGPR